MKVAVTFSSGMVLDMSPGVISTGTPPRRETYRNRNIRFVSQYGREKVTYPLQKKPEV